MSNVLFHEILLEAAEVVEVDDAAEEVEGDFTEEAEETTEAEKEDVAGTETEDTTIVPSTANVTGFGKTQAQVGVTLNHSASATVDSTDTRMLADDESNNARVEMAVNNTRNLLVDLPKTGGIGTVMFTVLGVCGTAAGAVVLAKSKRNDKKAA